MRSTPRPTKITTTMVALAPALALACASDPRIEPAPGASTTTHDTTAVAQEAGVRIRVTSETWDGFPSDLGDRVTPLKVSIRNESDRPVRVRYNEFALVDMENNRYRALPPYQMEGEVVMNQPVEKPEFASSGFYVAPYYHTVYPYLAPWRPFTFDVRYYDTYTPAWRYKMPTADILRQAIPEGVLDPGGTMKGFLFFEHLEADDVSRVRFEFDVVNANSGKEMASIRIPFTVQEEA